MKKISSDHKMCKELSALKWCKTDGSVKGINIYRNKERVIGVTIFATSNTCEHFIYTPEAE